MTRLAREPGHARRRRRAPLRGAAHPGAVSSARRRAGEQRRRRLPRRPPGQPVGRQRRAQIHGARHARKRRGRRPVRVCPTDVSYTRDDTRAGFHRLLQELSVFSRFFLLQVFPNRASPRELSSSLPSFASPCFLFHSVGGGASVSCARVWTKTKKRLDVRVRSETRGSQRARPSCFALNNSRERCFFREWREEGHTKPSSSSCAR